MSFVLPFEDANSMALSVVSEMLLRLGVKTSEVGRLEVGSQTLSDKSKSTKTVLMQLFKDNPDIQGVTSVNACYGGTNALFNALYWLTSPAWDGRYAIVVMTDVAAYSKGPARPTGGAGAVALLLGADPVVEFGLKHGTFMDDVYDFYKPQRRSTSDPLVQGSKTVDSYINALINSWVTFSRKTATSLSHLSYLAFHCPFYKMVQKGYVALHKHCNAQGDALKVFQEKVHPSLALNKQLGNIYTGSLYLGLISLFHLEGLKDKSVGLFSYGSGLASSFFSCKFVKDPRQLIQSQKIFQRLKSRAFLSPEVFESAMTVRQNNYGVHSLQPKVDACLVWPGAFTLARVDQRYRRSYLATNKEEQCCSESQLNGRALSLLQESLGKL